MRILCNRKIVSSGTHCMARSFTLQVWLTILFVVSFARLIQVFVVVRESRLHFKDFLHNQPMGFVNW